ncbi:MAG TPA: MFS transporter [Ramlibacter sp.]|nr:MFS transporter [Ramlibacter sp.]
MQQVLILGADGQVERRRRQATVLAIILASYTMIVLDISIVIAALPRIQQTLSVTATELSWVQNAYTLAFGSLLLIGARAGDLLGRRRMFMVGVAVFTLASLAVGLAQTAGWLIAARAAQGVGAAVLAPATLALLTTSFAEGPERTRAVAYYAAVAGVAASVGLVLGGVVTDLVSWRVGFLINVPVGVALVLAARRFIADSSRQGGDFDVAGALSSTVGMTALVYGIVRSAETGWGDTLTLACLLAAVVLLGFFVLHERRAPQPMMPPRLFASRERTGAYAARFLFLGAMVGFWFFTTQFLQGVLGYGAIGAGLGFLPTTLPNFAMAMAVPRLTRRLGNARLLALSLLVAIAGMVWLSQADAHSSYLLGVALPMVLIGIGQGGTLGPLTAAGIAGVAPEDAGAAGGVVNVAHQLGGSLGLALLITVFAAAAAPGLDAQGQLAHRISAALEVASGMLLLAFLLVFALVQRRPATLRKIQRSE